MGESLWLVASHEEERKTRAWQAAYLNFPWFTRLCGQLAAFLSMTLVQAKCLGMDVRCEYKEAKLERKLALFGGCRGENGKDWGFLPGL